MGLLTLGFLFAPAAVTRLTLERTGGFLPCFLAYATLALAWSVSVFLHEVGHAVGARLVGLRAYCLLSGGGPTILRRRVGELAVELRALPGSGLTVLASPLLPQMKWRLLATYAAGPAVTVSLLLFSLAVGGGWHEVRTPLTPWPSLGASLLLVNTLLLASVTIPLPRGSNVTAPGNDLLQMVTLPWLPQERLNTIATNAPNVEFHRLLLLRKYDEACDEAGRLLEVDPRNWIVRLGLADLMLFAGRHREAEPHYRTVLDDGLIPEDALGPGVRALIANNAAWNLFMLGDAQKIGTADKLSAQAIAALPKHPSVLGTRGAVLVEKGELVEGRELLQRALRLHAYRIPKANNLACLAIAAALEGRTRDAEESIRRARTMDNECELLPRAEQALAAVQQA
jgi:Flp pilus assembly protein TadD